MEKKFSFGDLVRYKWGNMDPPIIWKVIEYTTTNLVSVRLENEESKTSAVLGIHLCYVGGDRGQHLYAEEELVLVKSASTKAGIASCPFCGSNAEIEDQGSDILNQDYYAVTCSKCASTGEVCLNKEEAIAAWNNRV